MGVASCIRSCIVFAARCYANAAIDAMSPSVTFVNSVKKSNRRPILRLFSLSGSQTILIFAHQTLLQSSDGDPVTKTLNVGGVGKNRDSRRISDYRSMAGKVQTTATVHRAI